MVSGRLRMGFLLAVAVGLGLAGTTQSTRPAGKDWTADLGGGVKMKFVRIEPGEFVMGSPANEAGHQDEEVPHKVKITKPFFLGTTEVTQAQYKRVMGKEPSYGIGDDRPVESISWDDAAEFCRKLTSAERQAGRLRAGEEFRLPTEAEWEYACRAGSQAAYCFGNNRAALGDYAWHDAEEKTHRVAQKKPNAWGLYDMHGNVWEWCADWSGEYPDGQGVDPTGPGKGQGRMVRGGAFDSTPALCRSALRHRFGPDDPQRTIGFRCARTIVEP